MGKVQWVPLKHQRKHPRLGGLQSYNLHCHTPRTELETQNVATIHKDKKEAMPYLGEVSVLFLILSRILVRLRDAPAALQPHQPAWKL